MPSYNDRLVAKIEAKLAARAKMIVVLFRDFSEYFRSGDTTPRFVDRPPLCIGGGAKEQARVLAEWEKSRASLPRRVATAAAPSHSPDAASPSPDAETGTSGVDHGAE